MLVHDKVTFFYKHATTKKNKKHATAHGSWKQLGTARTNAQGTASKKFHLAPGKTYFVKTVTAAQGTVKSGHTKAKHITLKG